MEDHVAGSPSQGKQLDTAKRCFATCQKITFLIDDILGDVKTETRRSGSYALLRLLGEAAKISNNHVLQDQHTEDLLKEIKGSLDRLSARINKLDHSRLKSQSGKRERSGTKNFWKRIATYWSEELKRSTVIIRSGAQINSDLRYQGDFMDFAWSLHKIIKLETASKHALGEMLYSTLEE